MLSAIQKQFSSPVPAPLAEIPKQPAESKPGTLFQIKSGIETPADRGLDRVSLWQPCFIGAGTEAIGGEGDEHPLAMLTKIFLTQAWGENLADLFSGSIEHFFCKETLIRETPRLFPEEPMKSFQVLQPDEDPNISCTVLRDPAGEISVRCEAR